VRPAPAGAAGRAQPRASKANQHTRAPHPNPRRCKFLVTAMGIHFRKRGDGELYKGPGPVMFLVGWGGGWGWGVGGGV
jgi:hypothetical protein